MAAIQQAGFKDVEQVERVVCSDEVLLGFGKSLAADHPDLAAGLNILDSLIESLSGKVISVKIKGVKPQD
ncbi:MAG: hypothetical protein ACOY9Y_15785 [Bacillota bacterium]